jgi:uncharacterized Fe-S center protein
MSRSKKAAYIGKDCVACGVCIKQCPLAALSIYKGLFATVDYTKCVGCSKCATACPAGVITIKAKEGVAV